MVDELHTFDGAQGTDLACLIRRLKARLKTPSDFLCGVGTSATLGSDDEKQRLVEYAQEVFGEAFDEAAVITESRKSAGEYLAESFVTGRDVVTPERAPELDPEAYDGYAAYIRAQHTLWFGEVVPALGGAVLRTCRSDRGRAWVIAVKGHYFFQNLLKVLDGKPQGFRDVFERLERVTPEALKAVRAAGAPRRSTGKTS